MKDFLTRIKWNDQELVPAVIQDDTTDKVLTLCYMNEEALLRSMDEGKIYVFRRSKGKLMLKGESSGHIQLIKSVYLDCEGKSLLFRIEQKIAACHAGYFTCYYQQVDKDGSIEVVEKLVFDPDKVYK